MSDDKLENLRDIAIHCRCGGDVSFAKQDASACWLEQTGHDVEQCRLAAATWAQQSVSLPVLPFQIDLLESIIRLCLRIGEIAVRQIIKRDGCHVYPPDFLDAPRGNPASFPSPSK